MQRVTELPDPSPPPPSRHAQPSRQRWRAWRWRRSAARRWPRVELTIPFATRPPRTDGWRQQSSFIDPSGFDGDGEGGDDNGAGPDTATTTGYEIGSLNNSLTSVGAVDLSIDTSTPIDGPEEQTYAGGEEHAEASSNGDLYHPDAVGQNPWDGVSVERTTVIVHQQSDPASSQGENSRVTTPGSGGAGNASQSSSIEGTSANGAPLPYDPEAVVFALQLVGGLMGGVCLAAGVAAGVEVALGAQLSGEVAAEGATVELEASSATNAALLRNQLMSEEIAGGHAFEKHVLEQMEFPGITTREQFAAQIEDFLNSPDTIMRNLSNGRVGFWNDTTGTVLIRNPTAVDGGTYFVPNAGVTYFWSLP